MVSLACFLLLFLPFFSRSLACFLFLVLAVSVCACVCGAFYFVWFCSVFTLSSSFWFGLVWFGLVWFGFVCLFVCLFV